jgi:hypothetical protein
MIQKFKPFTSKNIKDNLTPKLNKYFEQAGIGMGDQKNKNTANFKALQAVGLQLLNFSLNGSSGESTVPPIKFGVLRGSGSVFVNGILVGDTKSNYSNGTPNNEYSTSTDNDVTVGYNTAYAAKLHETNWVPGGARPSKQATRNPAITGDVGNKWIEKHLKADGKVLLGLYADIFKKNMDKAE